MILLRSVFVPLVLAASAAACVAQTLELPLTLATEVHSQHVWRGTVLAEEITFQPSTLLDLGETGLTLELRGAMAAADRKNTYSRDRFEVRFLWDRPIPLDAPVRLSLGFTEYRFPRAGRGNRHTEEISVRLTGENVAAPSVAVYYDFGLMDSSYLTAGVHPCRELSLPWIDEVSANVSAAISNIGRPFGFHDVTATASAQIPAGFVKILPQVGFSYADEFVNPDRSAVWGGVALRIDP